MQVFITPPKFNIAPEKMMVGRWKMSFLLGLPNFRGYVKFQGCNCETPAEGFVSILLFG